MIAPAILATAVLALTSCSEKSKLTNECIRVVTNDYNKAYEKVVSSIPEYKLENSKFKVLDYKNYDKKGLLGEIKGKEYSVEIQYEDDSYPYKEFTSLAKDNTFTCTFNESGSIDSYTSSNGSLMYSIDKKLGK